MKHMIKILTICLLAIVSVQKVKAQETLNVYGFAHSYDSYKDIYYVSEVVKGVVNDKKLFDPDSQNLQNQFKKRIGEITGKSTQIMNHNAYGFMFKRFKPLSLNGAPEKKLELSTESTLEAMKKLRANKIAHYKKNGNKIVEISSAQFQYIQPKK